MTNYIGNIEDMGALRVYADNRLELDLLVQKIKHIFKGKIKSYENHYQTALNNKTPYMAHHFTILDMCLTYEIQVKTRRMGKMHDRMHPEYKEKGRQGIKKKYWPEAARLYSLGF